MENKKLNKKKMKGETEQCYVKGSLYSLNTGYLISQTSAFRNKVQRCYTYYMSLNRPRNSRFKIMLIQDNSMYNI